MIMNEVKYAENLLVTGYIGKKPSSILSILARYFRHKMSMNTNQIIDALDSYMSNNYEFYNRNAWSKTISSISKNSKKYPIREIDGIGISASELEKIKQLDNIKYEKIVFTMLCLAKYYNTLSENNNNWINTSVEDVFKLARVSEKKSIDKFYTLNKIYRLDGYISLSNKIDNMNIQIPFVDNEKPVITINCLEELGYEYMNISNPNMFYRCEDCNKLSKKNKFNDNRKKCKEHSGYQAKPQRMVICQDCKKAFFVNSMNNKTCRCEECQHEYIKAYDRERKKNSV